MISSNPAGVRAFMVNAVNGLILPAVTILIPSGENVGVFGGSPAATTEDVWSGGGGDFTKMDSMFAGIKVSNAALG
jgi:hypothetical protein